jgi:hypothetical protein
MRAFGISDTKRSSKMDARRRDAATVGDFPPSPRFRPSIVSLSKLALARANFKTLSAVAFVVVIGGGDFVAAVRALLLLVLVCASAVVVQGQACVPFRGSPATGFKCDSVVTYSNVLILLGQSYEQVQIHHHLPLLSYCLVLPALSCCTSLGFILLTHCCDWPASSARDLRAIQADKATSETTKLLGAFVPQACRSAAIRLACFGGFPECRVVPAFSCTRARRSVVCACVPVPSVVVH